MIKTRRGPVLLALAVTLVVAASAIFVSGYGHESAPPAVDPLRPPVEEESSAQAAQGTQRSPSARVDVEVPVVIEVVDNASGLAIPFAWVSVKGIVYEGDDSGKVKSPHLRAGARVIVGANKYIRRKLELTEGPQTVALDKCATINGIVVFAQGVDRPLPDFLRVTATGRSGVDDMFVSRKTVLNQDYSFTLEAGDAMSLELAVYYIGSRQKLGSVSWHYRSGFVQIYATPPKLALETVERRITVSYQQSAVQIWQELAGRAASKLVELQCLAALSAGERMAAIAAGDRQHPDRVTAADETIADGKFEFVVMLADGDWDVALDDRVQGIRYSWKTITLGPADTIIHLMMPPVGSVEALLKGVCAEEISIWKQPASCALYTVEGARVAVCYPQDGSATIYKAAIPTGQYYVAGYAVAKDKTKLRSYPKLIYILESGVTNVELDLKPASRVFIQGADVPCEGQIATLDGIVLAPFELRAGAKWSTFLPSGSYMVTATLSGHATTFAERIALYPGVDKEVVIR